MNTKRRAAKPGHGTSEQRFKPTLEHVDAVIGLGANLGHPLETFAQALERLAQLAPIQAYSRVYQSAPAGGRVQPDFINAAVRVEWNGAPRALMEHLLSIERRLGRVRGARCGPRVIDLDLLWISRVRSAERSVLLPHPRLTERAFALLPLLDVAPQACDPVSGHPYTGWKHTLAGQRIWPLSVAGAPWPPAV